MVFGKNEDNVKRKEITFWLSNYSEIIFGKGIYTHTIGICFSGCEHPHKV